MANVWMGIRPAAQFQLLKTIARTSPRTLHRALSTLPSNPHIYVHEQPEKASAKYLLSYLPKSPAIPSLAIGTAMQIPPAPESFRQNPEFMDIVHWVIREKAVNDPDVQGQAAMYASQAGSALGSGGMFFPQQRRRGKSSGGGGGAAGDGAGGASAQGGMGGAGRGGYIHVHDQRNPPDFGRVAYPEDIFGSLELDGHGKFVDGHGRYQQAGTYRVLTRDGILKLSDYLREQLILRLTELDAQARKHG